MENKKTINDYVKEIIEVEMQKKELIDDIIALKKEAKESGIDEGVLIELAKVHLMKTGKLENLEKAIEIYYN